MEHPLLHSFSTGVLRSLDFGFIYPTLHRWSTKVPRRHHFVILSNITQLVHDDAQNIIFGFYAILHNLNLRVPRRHFSVFFIYLILHNFSPSEPRSHYSGFLSTISQLEPNFAQEALFRVFFIQDNTTLAQGWPWGTSMFFLPNTTQLEPKSMQEALFWVFIEDYTTWARRFPGGTILCLLLGGSSGAPINLSSLYPT